MNTNASKELTSKEPVQDIRQLFDEHIDIPITDLPSNCSSNDCGIGFK